MRIHLPGVIMLLASSAGAPVPAADAGPGPAIAIMRAAVVSPGRVQLRDVARPVAGPGQVLVQLRYASVNPSDWKNAASAQIPGFDGAGVIAALGRGVAGYRAGDAVIVWSQAQGTYAQYVAVPADTITRKPERLSFAEAAGVAHAGLAAWNLLVDVAKVHSGQTVLVLGGAGGVGSAAVQIARNRGAKVIATVSARNAAYVATLGASSVIDYSVQHFEDQLRNIDVALNTVDIDNAYRALAVVRRSGYLLSTVGLPQAAQCAARAVTCSGPTANGTPYRLALKQIGDWAQAGTFKVNIDQTFELTDVLKAWQFSQGGHTRGKSVIRISD